MGANHPEVVVTAGQNAAKVVLFRIFSDVARANRLEANLLKDKILLWVIFRIFQMAERHRAEVALTAAQILLRQKIDSAFSRMAGRHRPEVVVTAG